MAYDYVQASGIGYDWLNIVGPWLKPVFVTKNRLDESKDVIKELIDDYNALLCGTVQYITDHASITNPVYFLDIRGTVGSNWEDELHPNRQAYREMAIQISRLIEDFHSNVNGALPAKCLRFNEQTTSFDDAQSNLPPTDAE